MTIVARPVIAWSSARCQWRIPTALTHAVAHSMRPTTQAAAVLREYSGARGPQQRVLQRTYSGGTRRSGYWRPENRFMVDCAYSSAL